MLEIYTNFLEDNGISNDEIKKQKLPSQHEICMLPSQISKFNNIMEKYQFKNLSEFIYNAYLYYNQ